MLNTRVIHLKVHFTQVNIYILPSGNLFHFAIEHGPFSIDLRYKMVIFHGFLLVFGDHPNDPNSSRPRREVEELVWARAAGDWDGRPSSIPHGAPCHEELRNTGTTK